MPDTEYELVLRWWRHPLWWLFVLGLAVVVIDLSHVVVSPPPPPPPPPATAQWPLAPEADGTHTLLTTYEQFLDPSGLPTTHTGADIAAAHMTPVFAAETGTVVMMIDISDSPGSDVGIVIESAAQPGQAFLYDHLDQSSLQFDCTSSKNAPHAGDLLGQVGIYPGGPNHLHLGRVEELYGSPATQDCPWAACIEIGCPLDHLPAPADNVAPSFGIPVLEVPSPIPCNVPIDAQPLLFYADDFGGNAYECPAKLPAGKALDIIAVLEDRTAALAPGVMPRRVSWTVTPAGGGAPVADGAIDLDGPQATADLFYRSTGDVYSHGVIDDPARIFHVIVTNGNDGAGHWTPTAPGGYVVTVTAEDHAGLTTSQSMNVTVQ